MKTTKRTKHALLWLPLIGLLFSCQNQGGADRVAQSEMGEYAAHAKGKVKSIDVAQFPETVLDIPYTATENPRQTLDIIYPSEGEAPYKTIVVIHGGGWKYGDKRAETLAPMLQATTQGYAVVTLNYRLSDEVTWPKPLQDVKTAIRFLRAKGADYELDTKKLVAWGSSAGGHIAMMLGATNNHPAFENLSMGYENFSSAVQGVISWYGVADISRVTNLGSHPANEIMGFNVQENWEKTNDANPINLVGPDFPPILLVHGTNDKVVPYMQSVNMKNVVNEATGREIATLMTVEGVGHGHVKFKTTENMNKYFDFADKILYNGNNPYRNQNAINIKTKR
ncbi:alpha/beta hydrolase [Perlabentimonas gracilis]|uniref:alpha/beta hydrolase n=1 Tax=Perlabentimonas gracilis TaxID=2715279 RepID=UPI00140A6307|nr:alpha/beta hydrolase [Perlabentimonas gracilis]NHB67983.1 alpha/beta hydrolase [Perlabentimonas gracilis]